MFAKAATMHMELHNFANTTHARTHTHTHTLYHDHLQGAEKTRPKLRQLYSTALFYDLTHYFVCLLTICLDAERTIKVNAYLCQFQVSLSEQSAGNRQGCEFQLSFVISSC